MNYKLEICFNFNVYAMFKPRYIKTKLKTSTETKSAADAPATKSITKNRKACGPFNLPDAIGRFFLVGCFASS